MTSSVVKVIGPDPKWSRPGRSGLDGALLLEEKGGDIRRLYEKHITKIKIPTQTK